MAIALEVGVSYLLTEFLANALVFLGPFKTAGTIAARSFKTFLHAIHYFTIRVK